MNTHDAIVVGAGVIGSAAAWHLAKRSRDVLVLERFEQGHVQGGSHGASRMFRLADPEPERARLAEAAFRQWHELEAEAGVSILDQVGEVHHGDPDHLRAVVGALSVDGTAFELLRPAEAAERWTGMRFDRQVLYRPDAGRINADLALRTANDVALERGAEIHFDERVLSMTPTPGGVVVRTDREQYRARVAVVTVGPWAQTVLKGLVQLPLIRVTQEQPAHFQPIDDAARWPNFYHRQELAGSGSAGVGNYGLLTPGEGVKVGQHALTVGDPATGVQVDPDDRDFATEPTRLARLKRYVEEWLPSLDPESAEPISCLYDTSPSRDFIIDRVGPIVFATGFSGSGFKFAPEIGRLLADLVDGAESIPPRFRLPSQ